MEEETNNPEAAPEPDEPKLALIHSGRSQIMLIAALFYGGLLVMVVIVALLILLQG